MNYKKALILERLHRMLIIEDSIPFDEAAWKDARARLNECFETDNRLQEFKDTLSEPD